MKIQLQGQSLRLRIDEAELARLQAGEAIENTTVLPEGLTLRQQVVATDGALARVVAQAQGFVFELPAAQLAPYIARLPCRDGLRFALSVAGADAIGIHFEVDVRDSVRNRGASRRNHSVSG